MFRKSAFLLIPIGLLLTTSLGGCDNKTAAAQTQQERSVPVRVSTPTPAPDADAVRAYGVVRPENQAALSFKIGGMIQAIHVDDGDQVRQGQVLAELDMREIDSHTARAELAVQKAKRDMDRIAPLAGKGFASAKSMDDARTALDAARAEQRAIEFDRSLARITASADGVVLARHADAREMIGQGAPVVTVSAGANAYMLKAGLGDKDVARVKTGDAAILTLDAFPGEKLHGRLSRIAAASDPRSGAFEVEIALDAAGKNLISGFMGEARITASIAGANTNALTIPASAIIEGHGSGAMIFVIDPKTGIAQQKRISIGKLDGENIIVTGGLEPSVKVVTAGANYLSDGTKVRIVEDIAAAPGIR